MKRFLAMLSALLMTLTATSCSGDSDAPTGNDSGASSASEDTSGEEDPGSEQKDLQPIRAISFSPEETEVTDIYYLSEHCSLEITAPEGAEVYYSTDGSQPDSSTGVYSEPIPVEQAMGDFPNCIVLKAKAVFADGSESAVVTHTFFAALDINSRFSNIVFSITGDPDDLFNKPDGLFYGKNYEKRGRESEIPVYVEAIDRNGEAIISQGAGARIYGAASRSASIKSLKLFARKSYDPDHGKFKIDAFGTVGADGEVISKYDKLVLRNAGNDFQFAFIRDELNQRLARQAGYTDTEAVVPAVVYLNGEYYGLLWLHETYCDDLLKDKYGDGEGTFEVIEGSEQHKNTDDEDEENAAAAEEFNQLYERLAYSDLTDDDTYAELCSLVDVENYLQNYAFNIYVNNNDWPQNNYKCYRYYAGEGEGYVKSGALDGRWRFIFHDTDYSMGLYQQNETMANYNNLAQIMREGSNRYSPLFTALMEREDCRESFIDEITELMNGVLSSDNICDTLEEMNMERYSEMKIYYQHLESMKSYDDSIWSWYEEYLSRTDNIRRFAADRAEQMKKFLIRQFELDENYFD